MQIGFTTLRGMVMQRPSLRMEALNILLELTTHEGMFSLLLAFKLFIKRIEKRIRGAAINTVKLWVPNTQPMDNVIRDFALQMLRKLQLRSSTEVRAQPAQVDVTMTNGDSNDGDDGMVDEIATQKFEIPKEARGEVEDGQQPQEDLVHTPYLPERIELPAKKAQVLQHVELLFALSVKIPEFLDKFAFFYYGDSFPFFDRVPILGFSLHMASWI